MKINGPSHRGVCFSRVAHLFILCVCLSVVHGQTLPELPNLTGFVTCFPDTTGYRRLTVGPEGRDYRDVQEALNVAEPGTILVLDAGVSFQGGLTLPDKGSDEKWIILISSRMDLLPLTENRIMPLEPTGDLEFPLQSDAMPKIITENPSGIPCLKTTASAHHYRFVGIEFTAASSVLNSYGLINLGDASSSQNTLDKVPHHLILDRCYIHGHDEGTIMKYGVRLDCAFGAVMDCHISQFHSIGFDAQAISGINGPGPFRILNNYLEASGENILIGGGAPAIQGLVPSDLEIRQNHFYKPWTWQVGHPEYAGKHWTIKNLFELKTGRRVLLEGNVLENCWADLPVGQSGYAILLTVRTEGGNAPQADVSDITIRYNIIRHVGAGISISGSDGVQSNRSARIHISHNLFDDIDGPRYGDQNIFGPNDGTFLKIGNPQDVRVDHNTIFQTGPVTWAYQVTDSFAFTNNIVNSLMSAGGYQGIYGPGQAQGNATLTTYFPDVLDTNQRFHKNVMIGGNANLYTLFNNVSQNYFPSMAEDVGFVQYETGSNDYHGYALNSGSPFFASGSDGQDIGVRISALDSVFMVARGCDTTLTFMVDVTPSNPELMLCPHPVNESMKVHLNGNDGVRYQIFNMLGIPLISGEGRLPDLEIETAFLLPGTYILCLRAPRSLISRTFIKI